MSTSDSLSAPDSAKSRCPSSVPTSASSMYRTSGSSSGWENSGRHSTGCQQRTLHTAEPTQSELESAQGWITQPPPGGWGMGRRGAGGKKPRRDTRAQTDKRTCLNGSKPLPQVNAKYDVVMKLSVFGTQTDTHTHKAKPIHPRYAGCDNTVSRSVASVQ